jgi:hypothetical protein
MATYESIIDVYGNVIYVKPEPTGVRIYFNQPGEKSKNVMLNFTDAGFLARKITDAISDVSFE